MALVSLSFKLDEDRVNRLGLVGITSIFDLRNVLAALDLGATVELYALSAKELASASPGDPEREGGKGSP